MSLCDYIIEKCLKVRVEDEQRRTEYHLYVSLITMREELRPTQVFLPKP
jgi:hypothetical protein